MYENSLTELYKQQMERAEADRAAREDLKESLLELSEAQTRTTALEIKITFIKARIQASEEMIITNVRDIYNLQRSGK